jgi:hypothetical protein
MKGDGESSSEAQGLSGFEDYKHYPKLLRFGLAAQWREAMVPFDS